MEIRDGTLTFIVSFAPGTLSPADVRCLVALDTDENPATGNTIGSESLRGSDYLISFVSPRNSYRGDLALWSGSSYRVVARTDVTFLGVEQARIIFPLSLLDDDGRLAFRVDVRQWISDTAQSGGLDYMPNLDLPPGLVH